MGFIPNLIEYQPCNVSKYVFNIDEACLDIVSEVLKNLTLWAQSAECDECKYTKVTLVPPYSTISLLTNTKFPWNFGIGDDSNATAFCSQSSKFTEYGKYYWNVTDTKCSSIYFTEPPPQPYLPIVTLIMIVCGSAAVWSLMRCVYTSDWLARLWPGNELSYEIQSDLGSPGSAADWEPPMVRAELSPIRRVRRRVYSVDTFRGLCITLMIFVNYGGGQYWFFKHSPWNGLTVADLVFPWFLWIMGLSLALSYRDQLRGGVGRRRLVATALQRSFTLVAVGVALNTYGCKMELLGDLRLPGVLQRIGVSYCVVALLEASFMKAQGSFQVGRWVILQDLLDSWLQWLVVLSFVGCHTAVTFLLEVPGCPTGYLGPGGDHDHGRHANCTGGAAGYVDRVVFGGRHMYLHPTSREVYNTSVPYDPEGLLGTLTAVLTVYLGVQSGRIMMSFNYTNQRISRWMAWALLTGLTAALLCGFSKNDGVIPMNKNLWSLSFALGLSSMAFVVQSVLYLIVDDKRWWGGSPLNAAGMNSILLYVGHEMTRHMFPWSWQPYYKTHWEYTMMNAWSTTLWVVIAFVLHKRKMYLKL